MNNFKQSLDQIKSNHFGADPQINYLDGPFHRLNFNNNEEKEVLIREIVSLENKKKAVQSDRIITSWGLTEQKVREMTSFETYSEDPTQNVQDSFNIMFVSEKDGKDALAKANKILCEAVQSKAIDVSTIDQSTIHSIISGKYSTTL